ncbi:MAG: hypothetical protein ACK5MK_15000 [Dysgonomonas sp.]
MADYNLNDEAGKIKNESGIALNTADRIGKWMEEASNEISEKPSFTLDSGKLPQSVIPFNVVQKDADGFVPAANLNGNLIGKKTFTSLSDFISSLDTAANYFFVSGLKQWEIIADSATYKVFTERNRAGYNVQIIVGGLTLTEAGAISPTVTASKPNTIMRNGLVSEWSKWEYQVKGDSNIYSALESFNTHRTDNSIHAINLTVTDITQLDTLLDGKIYNITENIGSNHINYILITGGYGIAMYAPSRYQIRYRLGILEQRNCMPTIDAQWSAWQSIALTSDLENKADLTKDSGEKIVYSDINGLITENIIPNTVLKEDNLAKSFSIIKPQADRLNSPFNNSNITEWDNLGDNPTANIRVENKTLYLSGTWKETDVYPYNCRIGFNIDPINYATKSKTYVVIAKGSVTASNLDHIVISNTEDSIDILSDISDGISTTFTGYFERTYTSGAIYPLPYVSVGFLVKDNTQDMLIDASFSVLSIFEKIDGWEIEDYLNAVDKGIFIPKYNTLTNKTFDLFSIEQQYLMGNFMLPFFPRGNNETTTRFLIDITTPVRMTVAGDAYFYTNNEGTEGETKELTIDTSYTFIYLKAKSKCYVTFHGANAITRLEISGQNSNDSPNPIVDSAFFPTNLIYLSIGGCFAITGEVRLGDLPQGIRQLDLYHFYSWGGVSKVTGNLSDFKPSQIYTFSIGEISDISVAGDLKSITDKHPRTLSLTTLGNLVFSGGTAPNDYEVSEVYLNTPVGWQSADTDRLLNYYASANWVGNKTFNLSNQKPHTSASNAAIATLVGKGVTVTVN